MRSQKVEDDGGDGDRVALLLSNPCHPSESSSSMGRRSVCVDRVNVTGVVLMDAEWVSEGKMYSCERTSAPVWLRRGIHMRCFISGTCMPSMSEPVEGHHPDEDYNFYISGMAVISSELTWIMAAGKQYPHFLLGFVTYLLRLFFQSLIEACPSLNHFCIRHNFINAMKQRTFVTQIHSTDRESNPPSSTC